MEHSKKDYDETVDKLPPKIFDATAFKDFGYLQEVNRTFFHPLGLSLATQGATPDRPPSFIVLDMRQDPEGFIFDFNKCDAADLRDAQAKCRRVIQEWNGKVPSRLRLLSEVIESIPGISGEYRK